MACCDNRKSKAAILAAQNRTKCTEQLPKLGYYAYASNPKAYQVRPKYRNDLDPPNRPKVNLHNYYNLMWDPHVYRGDTFKRFQTVELERQKAIDKDRKRKFKKPPPRKLGGIEIPQTPPPAEGHERNVVATERFLEEFAVVVEEVDATTQTDIIDEAPPPPILVPAKSGYDVATEIFPEELYHFEEEVTPIVSTLAWKVLEQSLLEFNEEEELRQLSIEQMQHEERRRLDLVRMKRLAEREQQMHAERSALMEMFKKQMSEEKESEERVGAFLFSCSYLKELLPNCLETLAAEGFLHNKDVAEITETFKPWVESEVKREIGQKLLSRAIVDDLIRHVAREKESEVAARMWPSPEEMYSNKYYEYYDMQPEYDE